MVRDTVMTRRMAAPKALRSWSMPKNGSKSASNICGCWLGIVPALVEPPAGGTCCVLLVLVSAILLK